MMRTMRQSTSEGCRSCICQALFMFEHFSWCMHCGCPNNSEGDHFIKVYTVSTFTSVFVLYMQTYRTYHSVQTDTACTTCWEHCYLNATTSLQETLIVKLIRPGLWHSSTCNHGYRPDGVRRWLEAHFSAK